MNLSSSVYDKLKFLAQVVLPAVSALLLGLNGIWDFANQDRLVATVAVLNTALGLYLANSARQYKGAGDLVVTTDQSDGTSFLSADLNEHPQTFQEGRNVTLNVRHESIPA